jgi:putative lipoprotein
MTRPIVLFALFGLLVGCSGTAEPDYATLDVELSYLERIALPPGAHAVAALRQSEEPADPQAIAAPAGPGTIVARSAVEIKGSVPVTVRLRYDRGALDPAKALVIDGWIFAEDQVLFAVPESPRVWPGGTTPARLVLRRPRHVVFGCADKSQPSVAFMPMGTLAFLEQTGAPPTALRAQPVASGYHYSGDGFSLRGKGNEALLRRPAGSETRCETRAP